LNGALEIPGQPRPGCWRASRTTRLRDIAASLGITERSAHGIVTLTEAGYLIRQKAGRRNRYEVQAHVRVPAGKKTVSGPIRAGPVILQAAGTQ
jgi:hypothetical protein